MAKFELVSIAYSHEKAFVFVFAHHCEEKHGIGAISQGKDNFSSQKFFGNHPVLHDGFGEELAGFVSVLSANERTVEYELEESVVVKQRQACCVDFFNQEVRRLFVKLIE